MQLSTLIRSQGEGGNPLARREAGETTLPRGCSCFPPIVVACCRRPSSVLRGPCSLSGCKPHPSSTRPPTPRLLSWIGNRLLCHTHARRFPTASNVAPIREGVVDRELPDCDAPERERSSLSRRILRRTRLKTPRRDVPSARSALEQYSLSQRSAPGASLKKTTFGGGTTQDNVLEVTSNLRSPPTTSLRRPHGDQKVCRGWVLPRVSAAQLACQHGGRPGRR